MDYMKWSREKLIERIDELTLLSAQLLRKETRKAGLIMTGPKSWPLVLEYQTNSVTFNPLKVTTLGYELPEDGTPVPYQFLPKNCTRMITNLR